MDSAIDSPARGVPATVAFRTGESPILPPAFSYSGPVFRRTDQPLLRAFLEQRRTKHFVYLATPMTPLPPRCPRDGWHRPDDLPRYVRVAHAGLCRILF